MATIYGTTGNDILIGDQAGASNDTIFGFGGADRLLGGVGTNTLDGGLGIDTADYGLISPYAGPVLSVTANLGTGVAVATYGVGPGTDTLVNIENLRGSNGNDNLTGNGGANKLEGGAGNDFLNGGGGNDNVLGGAGSDSLTGGTGADNLNGNAGADTYHWAVGDGKDTYNDSGGTGNDEIIGDGGSFTGLQDSFSAANGIDEISNVSNIQIASPATWNFIGVDTHGVPLRGAGGNDNITGTDAYGESISGFGGNDTLNGAGGNDVVNGGAGNDNLLGGDGNDIVNGGAGNDAMAGNDGDDNLLGDGGNDFMNGGAGNDVLNGQTGQDSYTGGAGDDTFIVSESGTTTNVSFSDVIFDMQGAGKVPGYQMPGFPLGTPGPKDWVGFDVDNPAAGYVELVTTTPSGDAAIFMFGDDSGPGKLIVIGFDDTEPTLASAQSFIADGPGPNGTAAYGFI